MVEFNAESQAMSGMSSTVLIDLAIAPAACAMSYLSQKVRYLMQRYQVSTGHAEPNINPGAFLVLIHSRTASKNAGVSSGNLNTPLCASLKP